MTPSLYSSPGCPGAFLTLTCCPVRYSLVETVLNPAGLMQGLSGITIHRKTHLEIPLFAEGAVGLEPMVPDDNLVQNYTRKRRQKELTQGV